jgi:GNAT superfamily N-acetyltransferase
MKNLKSFVTLRNIYLSTFPLENAKQLDTYINHIHDIFGYDNIYHLYAALEDGSIIGISLLYIFDNLKMALLDYMAVTPNFQRRGIGKKLFEFTNNEFNRCIPDNIGMLLEVPKENVFDPDELLRRKRRIQFYSRLGVKLLRGVNYLLPIQIDGDVEEMYLMIKLSKNISWISKKNIANFINSVYSDLYECRKSDLLDKTINNLPDHIQIEELKV